MRARGTAGNDVVCKHGQSDGHDEAAAFAYLDSAIRPNGATCPHCGCSGRTAKVKANPEQRVRIGLYRCGDCKKQFRATVGTVFGHVRIPLDLCLQAAHLMGSSKKGMSALQISRVLGQLCLLQTHASWRSRSL